MKRRSFIKGLGSATAALPLTGCKGILMSSGFDLMKPKGEITRRTLGKTGIQVSMLGFGSHLKTELIADPVYRDNMIKAGYEGGINIFDVYDHSGYKQFKPMGKSIKDFRKDVIVSLCVVQSTDKIQSEIDGALQDFFTDYIDLYRLFEVSDERMSYMEKNKKDGKIRFIGVVSHDANEMMSFLDRYGDILDYVMMPYNFHHNRGLPNNKAYPKNDYSTLIPRCKSMNMGIVGIKPMGSDYMIDFAKAEKFFDDKNANIPQAMLRYVYQAEEIHCTCTAMNSMEELITNLESAYSPSITDYEKKILEDLSAKAALMKGAYLPRHYKWLENWAVRTV